MKKVKLIKLGYVENPLHSDSDFGESAPFHVGFYQGMPVVGETFTMGAMSGKNGERGIRTSTVIKIEGDKFHTKNSIYKFEIIE